MKEQVEAEIGGWKESWQERIRGAQAKGREAFLEEWKLVLEQLDETGLLEQDPAPVAPPVCLTQKDVRMVQLAKSAICAGLSTLLRVEGLCGADAAELAVAGGFGSYLDVDSAGRIGLLPEELVPRVRVLGNAALSGAAMLLLNRGFIPHSEALAAGARTVDLSTSAEFMNAYTEGMFF